MGSAQHHRVTAPPAESCDRDVPAPSVRPQEESGNVSPVLRLTPSPLSACQQKARDNRAAQRINKVQHEPLKRLQPPQQPYEPVSMETEAMFSDPLRPKELEQEQEWKYRQGEVRDRWGADKKRQGNLSQSKALKSPTHKDWPYQASVAGAGREALQMRQKSKQLAKMEATQKLEQVKNEQLQQKQQLVSAQHLCVSTETGSQSSMMVTQQPPAGGNASPLQPVASRDGQARSHLHLQGSQSGLAEDVFLRPQAPPPSGFSSLPHSPHSSSPHHQLPSSPQMFSPPSSRPSSPWDPCSKVAGTPRPASSQSAGPQVQQQRRSSLSASPAQDALGSPTPSPDPKTSDPSRALGSQPGLQQGRAGMMSPPSGSTPDHLARHASIRGTESYQRTLHNSSGARMATSEPCGRANEMVQGGLFKAPMPPHQQLQQEVFGGTGGGRSRPADPGLPLPQPQDSAFPSSPLSGLSSPHRSPYAQTPGTPRPDYSQQIPDPFAQHSPLTSRPSPDPYSNPQTPGTPRPHSDPAYLSTPPTLRVEQFCQQSANRRPSPSHPNIDPYGSNPGTPRPSVTERFPRSPGGQRGADSYAQPAGTPRPSPDPYAQQPSTPRPQKAPEPFGQAPAESGCGSAPLAAGLSGETAGFIPTHHQSPGRQQHQTQKHAVMSEDGSFSSRAGHEPAEHGHMTPAPLQTEKTAANEMAALGSAVLDGPISMLPQLGDSEEKLRQRQRLRQLILRQQQQKNALRQEKGLQEHASAPPAAPPGPAPTSATPHRWSQDDSSPAATPQTDLFGRPPPPYPGTVRPSVASGAPRFPGGFPGEQQRVFQPSEAPFPRQSFPREAGVRNPSLRFGVPPGAPAGLPDPFLHPPQGSLPGSGLGLPEGVLVQMRRQVSGEFAGVRHLAAANVLPHTAAGVPSFPPRSLAIQPHSIMGQPYIELRHRAPENRLRLPFPLPGAPDPETPLLHPRDPTTQQPPARPPHGARMGEVVLSQQMAMAGGVEQLGHGEPTLPGPDGLEEHLEGEDSAVKDLEDVEVKDLVDLNLNLDPEDGKEDLDLGPNDLHLDDFLLSGKFDLIAYADPELNLEDKKDMFNEELDLGEPVEEKEGGERSDGGSDSRAGVGVSRKPESHAHPLSQVKQEVKDCIKTESTDGPSTAQCPSPQPGAMTTSRPPGAPGGPGPPGAEAGGSSQPDSSPLLTKEKVEDSGSGLGVFPTLQAQAQAPSSSMAPRVHPPMGAGQPLLLLEEQPLLLQELLDQERQEQQQQKQMQAIIRQRSSTEFPNMDFDSISDPIMKAKMVALKGINKVMTQGSLGLNSMVINRFQQAPAALDSEVTPLPPHPLGQDGKLNSPLVRPSPPSFDSGFVNESQRRQYEEWLGETQQLLQMQQRLLEEQITAHRKTKKALSAKQRTAKKAGRVLSEEDAAQLRLITEQQGTVQKQLEQIRKQQKDHAELIDDYRNKQQHQMQQQQPPPVMAAAAPPMPQTVLGQPMMPMQPHPAGPAPARVPGWTLGGGPPGTVKFDDNNPFSEGFQERERRERLREQQERQRVQLMQEVERHRALQQRLELEQQGMLGASVGPGPGVAAIPSAGALPGSRVGPSSGPGVCVGGPPRSAPAPSGDTLSQMPFFSSELPQDFLQAPPACRAPQQQGFRGGPLASAAATDRCRAQPEHGGPMDVVSSGLQVRLRHPGPSGPSVQAQVRPPGVAGTGMTAPHPGSQSYPFGPDSSSPSTPLPPSFPGSSSGGGPASLTQLYSDIIPDDKPKKKRNNRKKDGADAMGGVRISLSSHSEDITAPPIPAFSGTSCSMPTGGSMDHSDAPPSSCLSSLAPSSELESQRGFLSGARLQVKEEREEGDACGAQVQKMEEGGVSCSPLHGGGWKDGDRGKELLRHLLKDKNSPATTPSPSSQAPPPCRQLSTDSIQSEEEEEGGGAGSYSNMVMMDSPDQDLSESSGRKKLQRSGSPVRQGIKVVSTTVSL
ncbi:hypothetical protein LDENG_00240600 [Lucifuga dentata]|nr:hypothetical protein LDENG_00240600 [Lucifuga dentata]